VQSLALRLPPAVRAVVRLGLSILCGLPCACGGDAPTPSSPKSASGVRYGSDGAPDRAAGPATSAATPRRDWNVLWICLDTVRADAFAPWATGAAPMPRSSAWLSRDAVTFKQAASTAPWTGPSISSLLTGLLPSRHGARELSDGLTLVAAVATAAEILGQQGWMTGAYTGGGWLTKDSGILQGVTDVNAPFSFGALGPKLIAKSRKAKGVMRRFLFLHTYEAHDPYLAPFAQPGPVPPSANLTPTDLAAIDREAEADGGRALARRFLLDPATRSAVFGTVAGRGRIAAVTRWFEQGFPADPQRDAFAAEARTAYEKGLARLDGALADFFEGMLAEGLFDDTVLIVSSDHGEGFGEHRAIVHGRRLYDELVHVPLFVRAPDWPAGRVVEGSCSLADVLPTVIELLGLPAPDPESMDGRSLVPLLAGGAGRPVTSEERRTTSETGLPDDETLVSVRDAAHKWIHTLNLLSGASSEEAYDLAADPREERALPAGAADAWPAAFREAIERARKTR
jgi:arylsulfatase A-like enzyme